jgi:hypothetical protein
MFVKDDVVQILKLAKDRRDFGGVKARCLGQFVDGGRAAFSQVELEKFIANIASNIIHVAWEINSNLYNIKL